MTNPKSRIWLLATALCGAANWNSAALAEPPASAGSPVSESSSNAPGANAAPSVEQDIVVTARKRQETSLGAPVALTAVGVDELSRRGITSLEGLSRVAPELVLGPSVSVQGGSISMRGLGGTGTNPFSDQAVSFVADGAQVARASILPMAQVDLAQVEVLRGPQALFFGKNSPAGIVVLRSADPGSTFEMGGSIGYEFVGDETRGEAYVSGPLSDAVGARIVVYGGELGGYAENVAPTSAVTGEPRRWGPNDRTYGARATVVVAPSDRFTARFKLNYSHVASSGLAANSQLIYCSRGVSQLNGAADDCKANAKVIRANPGPALGAMVTATGIDQRSGAGLPYLTQSQVLGSLELNYDLTDDLNLVSSTSYYRSKFDWFDNVGRTATSTALLASFNRLDIEEVTEEVRLSSSFDGPVNFLVGGLYQDSDLLNDIVFGFNAVTPVRLGFQGPRQDGNAYSGFGQVTWNVTPEIELAGGGRYSKETKNFSPLVNGVPIVTAVPKRSFENFSPEVTLTWRPSTRATVYGAYKKGFLSGGFNAGTGNLANDRSFRQTTVRDFEGGVKARLFDDTLRLDLAVYDEEIKGLQVASFNAATTSQEISNAGSASTKGLEFAAHYRPPVEGLTLHAQANYTRARYEAFAAPCLTGQTIAQGCTLIRNPVTGAFTAQDLAGQQIVRAPTWTVLSGFNLERPIGSNLNISFSADANYSSSYFTDGVNRPEARQPSFWLLDASLRLGQQNDGWELALIGRNLGNEYYVTTSGEATFTGRSSATGTNNPTVLSDQGAIVSRGREIWLRTSLKY